MQQFNPRVKGLFQVRDELGKKDRMRVSRTKRVISGGEYNRTEHKYRKVVGKLNTGETKVMLGKDAGLENRLNILKFGSGEDKDLIQWVWMRKEEKEINDAVMRIIDIIDK